MTGVDRMAQAFEDHLTAIDERKAAGAAAYEAAKKLGRLKSHRIIAYRCPRRCLLLDVVIFPEPVGVIFHVPRYRLSPAVNAETSNESGRENNTEDGDRRWKSRTFAPEFNTALSCDHIHHVVVSRERIQRDINAGCREVVVTAVDHEPSPPFANP